MVIYLQSRDENPVVQSFYLQNLLSLRTCLCLRKLRTKEGGNGKIRMVRLPEKFANAVQSLQTQVFSGVPLILQLLSIWKVL